jgi:putative SOS response-associated peptidase YedK
VPADAFYEWQKLDAKTKQPFAIAMKDGQPYALAGLWEKWKDRQARTELPTFTVITTDPTQVVQPMHDRMPVIIPERDYDRWLRADPNRPPIDLLRPYDADRMTAWKVDKVGGNVKNDSPELIEPASKDPAKVQGSSRKSRSQRDGRLQSVREGGLTAFPCQMLTVMRERRPCGRSN